MTQAETETRPGQIVVLERQPYWQPELQRQLPSDEYVVRGCRMIADLDQLTQRDDSAVAVIDLSVDAAGLLRWIARRLTAGPTIPTIVVVNEQFQSLQWHARELGALAVVSEFVGGHKLARLCRKQFA